MSETTNNLPAVNIQQLGKQLAERTKQVRLEQGEVPFLRLLKEGLWVYGADDIEVQPGSLWAANPTSLMDGFCAWGDSELLGEEMQPMTSPTPLLASQMADVGAPWKRQIAVQMVCLNGEDQGQAVLYKTSSKGGLKAASGLIDAIIEQIELGSSDIVPIMKLETDSYKHKKYGKIYTPVLDIAEWRSLTDAPEPTTDPVPEDEQGQADDYGDTTAAQTGEPAAEEPAPRRRRRAIAS